MAYDHDVGKRKEVKENMSLLQTVLQTAPSQAFRAGGYAGGSFIFGAISAVSILIIAVGIFYVLMKLGSFLDAMKEKTEASSAKK
jgi:hypothetical protein